MIFKCCYFLFLAKFLTNSCYERPNLNIKKMQTNKKNEKNKTTIATYHNVFFKFEKKEIEHFLIK